MSDPAPEGKKGWLQRLSDGMSRSSRQLSEQLEQLKSRGCDYIQGFLVSRPLSFEDFQAYLAK